MKKKVCMIIPSFTAKGGITTVVNGYRGSLLEEEYDIKYIETYCDGSKIEKIRKAINAFCCFVRLVKKSKPDIVHIHSSFGGSFYRKLPFIYYSYRKQIPVINHVHGSEIDKLYTNASTRRKRLIERTFDKCSLIITLSNETKEKLSVIKTNTPKEVVCNYCNIQKKPEKPRGKIVLFLGFLTQLKGCFDIPDIVKIVKAHISQVQFVLAGVGEEKAIRDKLENLQVAKYVQFPGWVTNKTKEDLINSCSVFFLPSYTEAMPMSILEAMGYGKPIVATNVGGIPQLVKDGINGYLLKPGDKIGLANALIDILSNDEKQNEYGLCSLKIANDEFSKESHMKKIGNIYRKALEDKL